MEKYSEDEIKKKLKAAFWDVNISADELYEILKSDCDFKKFHVDKKSIYCRILNTYGWYTILKIFSLQEIKSMLKDDVLIKLFPKSLKTKYQYVRRVLFEQPLSSAGQSS